MSLFYIILWICSLFVANEAPANVQQMRPSDRPRDVALRVGNKIINNRAIFLVWDYGGALIFDGLQQTSKLFGFNFTNVTDSYLDDYKVQPWAFGYKLLHNVTIPRGSAVGDTVGLFPIAYLNRIPPNSDIIVESRRKTDWAIISKVATRLLTWPKRLRDGTLSRDSGWRGEPKGGASFLWADDQYMGLVLLARLAKVTRNDSLAHYVTTQALTFAQHLADPEDGLYYHGYDDTNGHVSCCKWGRANGWAIMAHVEILEMLESLKLNSTKMQILLETQSKALLKYQSSDGRFHQVINESTTFLETSCTAMVVTSWARALRHSWLDGDVYSAALWRAWKGLISQVQDDGKVNGICMGTGIQATLADYEYRPCPYILSGDGGLGAVLSAATEMEKYIRYIAEYTNSL